MPGTKITVNTASLKLFKLMQAVMLALMFILIQISAFFPSTTASCISWIGKLGNHCSSTL